MEKIKYIAAGIVVVTAHGIMVSRAPGFASSPASPGTEIIIAVVVSLVAALVMQFLRGEARAGKSDLMQNNKELFSESFQRMSRIEQEELIEKFSVVSAVYAAILLCLAFSALAPVRLFGYPVALIAAWWVGSNIVAGMVIDRMEGILKKDG